MMPITSDQDTSYNIQPQHSFISIFPFTKIYLKRVKIMPFHFYGDRSWRNSLYPDIPTLNYFLKKND